MGLRTITASDYSGVRSATKCTIRINQKSGIISLSDGLRSLLEAEENTTITVSEDGDSDEVMYIHKHDDGFQLRAVSKSTSLAFNSKAVASIIAKKVATSALEGSSFIITVGTEPVDFGDGIKYYELILGSARI